MNTITTTRTTAEKSQVQRLEELKGRLQRLTERHTRLHVEYEAASRQLNDTLAEAERDYGTRDIEELRRIYAERKQQNERTLEEFATSLDRVEQELNEIEKQLAS